DAREPQDLPLDPAAHRAGLVEEGPDAAASRQHEGLERREVLLARVDQALELPDLGLSYPVHALVHGLLGRGQLAAEVEELVLEPPEDLVEPAMPLGLGEPLLVEDSGEAEDRIQLVEAAVRLDPRRVLGHARAA